jgi:hypothetical protein
MVNLTARLEAAALSLAGPGNIKERLTDAYCRHLEGIHESDLPSELSLQFGDMIQALHRVRALPGDDVVKASVRKLSNHEACRYAELVVRLYGMLAGMQYHVSTRIARAAAPAPSFLAAEAGS